MHQLLAILFAPSIIGAAVAVVLFNRSEMSDTTNL